MSCAMTVDAVLAQTKSVTRRHVDTWKTLKPGDQLTLIEKGMGLKKGENQVILAEVRIVAVTVEPLDVQTLGMNWPRFHSDTRPHLTVTQEEVHLEGLKSITPSTFCSWWASEHGYRHRTWKCLDQSYRLYGTKNAVDPVEEILCRRIEWEYLNHGPLSEER